MRAPSARSGVPGEEERVRIAARLWRMRLTTRSDEGDEEQGETPASFLASSTSESQSQTCIGQLELSDPVYHPGTFARTCLSIDRPQRLSYTEEG